MQLTEYRGPHRLHLPTAALTVLALGMGARLRILVPHLQVEMLRRLFRFQVAVFQCEVGEGLLHLMILAAPNCLPLLRLMHQCCR